MNNKIKNIQKVFDIYADSYDTKYKSLNMYKSVLPNLLKTITPDHKSLLDLGCGPAHLSKYIFNNTPISKITGIDISSKMIEIAKINIPNGHFELEDVDDFHDNENTYDFIISGFVIPYLNTSSVNLHFLKIKKLLSKNGLLLICLIESNNIRSEVITSQDGRFSNRMYFYNQEFILDKLKDLNLNLLYKESKEQKDNPNGSNDLIIYCRNK